MLISPRTYNILKNFHGINTGFAFRKGFKQTTISPDEDILAEATLDEDIPQEIGIYDLSRFIGNLNNLDKPSIDFDTHAISIHDKNTAVTYFSCKTDLLKTPKPDINLTLKTVDLDFKLEASVLAKAIKIAATNGSDRISFECDKKGVFAVVFNAKDNTANRAKIFIDEHKSTKTSKIAFSVEVLNKLLDNTDYNVQIDITEYGMGVFTSADGSIRYFVSQAL